MEQILTRREQRRRRGLRRERRPGQLGHQRHGGRRDRAALLSGQDATAAGIQNILLGKQTMTVYKPIEAEAEVAVVALALQGTAETRRTSRIERCAEYR